MKKGKRASGGNARQRRYLRRFYQRRGWNLLYWMIPYPSKISAKPVAPAAVNAGVNPPSATVIVALGEKVIANVPVDAEKAAQVVEDLTDFADDCLKEIFEEGVGHLKDITDQPIKNHPVDDFIRVALAFINHSGELKDPEDYFDKIDDDDCSWAEVRKRFLDEVDMLLDFGLSSLPDAAGQPAGCYCASGYRFAERPVAKRPGWLSRLIR